MSGYSSHLTVTSSAAANEAAGAAASEAATHIGKLTSVLTVTLSAAGAAASGAAEAAASEAATHIGKLMPVLTVNSAASGAAVSQSVTHKMAAYITIASTHPLVPVAIEPFGVFDDEADEFVQPARHRFTDVNLCTCGQWSNHLTTQISHAHANVYTVFV